MRIISIQKAYKRKFERQKNIKELEYHAAGHCVHIGKLSPGCYGCFVPASFRTNIETGVRCNLSCIYCLSDRAKKEEPSSLLRKAKFLGKSYLPNYNPLAISFSGGGEPLLYMDIIKDNMKFFRDIEKETAKRPWYYIYTNGILVNAETLSKLQDLGIDEIRFHLGASNFSEKVYKNLKESIRYFKAVTVETPAWPLHRKKLFEMLPKIADIGVKHLNIGEVEINKSNYRTISRMLPRGEIYQCGTMFLYDGGLVYDLIEEILRRNYSYSVLDCNCFVKSIQRNEGKHIYYEDVKALCAEY